ncbi:putative auxin efflux carrier component 5a [Carex rostrata]
MIEWRDIYKVVAAMVPLYVALGLGYGSVRWWKIFTPDHCEAINRFVMLFIIPFFVFDFTIHTNPYTMNYQFLASDGIAKSATILVLAVWVKFGRKGSYAWSLTSFSLSTQNNTLVVGVPLFKALYGKWAQDLIVQVSVVQATLWFSALLLGLEIRKASIGLPLTNKELKNIGCTEESAVKIEEVVEVVEARVPLRLLVKTVWRRLSRNPNVYASILGLTFSCIVNRWKLELPSVIEGSIQVMSRAGTGTAMFSMGLFMALQEKTIACGVSLTILGMVLRFIVGPATALIGALAMGLRGDVLRFAIIQAALPQSVTTFTFAREYGLHADVLSTAVIFGTLVSLPVLIAYYVCLGLIN